MSTDQKPTVTPSVAEETSAQTPVPTATADATTPVTTANTDVAASEEETDHKVFVGNLSFQTKEEGLVKFFETSGKVLEAKIITVRQRHYRRSAGYGFVSFATLEDATKAAKDLNKKELDGREINVEVARPKPVKPRTDHKSDAITSESDAPQKPRKRRVRKNKDKKVEEGEKNESNGEPTNAEDTAATKQVKKAKDAATTDEDEAQAQSDASDASSSRPRARRQRNKNKKKNPAPRRVKKELTEPSKTTLFVANLPYASVDETLETIFKDYKIKSAHVARMKNGRSKGYGFVEFETEEEQLKALENVKDVELEGRTIYLKIALSESPKEADAEHQESTADVQQVEENAKKQQTKADDKKEQAKADDKKDEVKTEQPKAEVKKTEVKAEQPKAEIKKAEVKAQGKENGVTAEQKPAAK